MKNLNTKQPILKDKEIKSEEDVKAKDLFKMQWIERSLGSQEPEYEEEEKIEPDYPQQKILR